MTNECFSQRNDFACSAGRVTRKGLDYGCVITFHTRTKVAYFPDLSPYAYGHGHHPGVVHVGWLDGAHPFPKGQVEPALVEKLKLLATKPVELYRGKHICEVCIRPPNIVQTYVPNRGKMIDPDSAWMKWASERWSNGEIRVANDGVIFASPVLIVHYIQEHSYLPPTEFLEAVAKAELPIQISTD
jgi:hypothetical protein